MKQYLLSLLFLCCMMQAWSQPQPRRDEDLVQFSGLVITADSLRALPLVTVRIKSMNKGTYSDAGGFFSFVARKGDTVVFSSIGMRVVEFVIPRDLRTTRYSIVQPMTEDTIYLPETVIRPWPTHEEFNYYFVKANIPDDYGAQARYNTRRQALVALGSTMPMDARENQNYYQQQQSSRYYSNGQLPPQRLFDPFAWGQFFNAWKRGDFKKKD